MRPSRRLFHPDGRPHAAHTVSRVQAGAFAVADKFYFPGAAMPRHAHEYSTVSVVLGGSMLEVGAAQEFLATEGALLAKPAGVEHSNLTGVAGARLLEIRLPDSFAAARLAYRRRKGGPHADAASHLLREMRAGDAASLLAIEEICELLVQSSASSARGLPEAPKATSLGPPRWIREVAALLREECGATVRQDEIARRFDVHPVYLARVFRRHLRCSMGEYLRRARIEHAMRALNRANPEPLATIAADAGFSDQSHFTRLFKRYTGLTPGEFRNLTLADPVPGRCETRCEPRPIRRRLVARGSANSLRVTTPSPVLRPE